MRDLKDLPITVAPDQHTVVSHVIANWQAADRQVILHYIYYANFVLLDKNETYYNSLAICDYILIDGIGMQLYMKIVKGLWPVNLNGTDLNPVFLKELDSLRIPIALYGTNEENINKAEKNISAYLPNDSIYYVQDGFTPLNWTVIREGSALFIGMGSPRQENWVSEHFAVIKEKKLLVITVGGFFDFASGFYIRAPKLVRKIKMEWAWRTMLHPARHMKKRLYDLSILFRPLWHKLSCQSGKINIREI